LLLRWPSPEAAIEELHAIMVSRGWSRSELAELVDVSARTAARLATKTTPTLSIFLRWCTASGRDFFVEAEKKDDAAATRSNDDQRLVEPRLVTSRQPLSSPQAAAITAASGQDREHDGAEATGVATSGLDRPAGTACLAQAVEHDGTSGPGPARTETCSPEAAAHLGTSGPPSAQLIAGVPQAAIVIGTSGQVQKSRGPSSGESDLTGEPMARLTPTCPIRHVTSGHQPCGGMFGHMAATYDIDDACAGLGTSGPRSEDQHVDASAEAVDLSDPLEAAGRARKKGLPTPTGAEQPSPVMASVEWKKDGEVICTQTCAREDLKETLQAMSRVPSLKGAEPYVDGRRRSLKSRRRDTDTAAIEEVLARELKPILDGYDRLEKRQTELERRQVPERYLGENIENLQKLLAPAPSPSRLQCMVRAFVDEINEEGE